MDWRPITTDDCPAWAAFVAAVAEADDTGEHYSAEDLAEELTEPGVTVLGGWDGAVLAAVGQAFPSERRYDGSVRATFLGGVHPEHRGRGIGSELAARMEQTVEAGAAEHFPGEPVHPSTRLADSAREACALFEKRGYEIIRYFHEMEAQPQQTFRNPRLQRFRPQLDAAVLKAHRAAFASHWGSVPISEEEWRLLRTGSRAFRPELSTVAATIDGQVDGYVLTYQYAPDEAYIGQVGVRPELRGRGLARKLMQATLAEIAAAGIERVTLEVDADSPTGAGRLYESTGFHRIRTFRIYERL